MIWWPLTRQRHRLTSTSEQSRSRHRHLGSSRPQLLWGHLWTGIERGDHHDEYQFFMTCLLPSLDYVVAVLLTATSFCRYLEGLRTRTRRWLKRWRKRRLRGTRRTRRRRRNAGAAFMTQGRRCAGGVKIGYLYAIRRLATGCYYFWLLAKILAILMINCDITCL